MYYCPTEGKKVFIGRYPEKALNFFFKGRVSFDGGSEEATKNILEWMMGSCNKGRLLPYPTKPSPNLVTYFNAAETANALNLPMLSTELSQRMGAICAKQVHEEDCKTVFSQYPENHILRKMAATSIGDAVWERHLLKNANDPKYKTRLYYANKFFALRKELPDFDAAVNAVIAPKKQELTAAKKELKEKEVEETMRKAAEKKAEKEASYQRQMMATVKVPKMDASTSAAVNAQILALNEKKSII